MNPILTKRYLFFTSARVILDDELFLQLVRERAYPYIIGISHDILRVLPTMRVKHKKTINIYLDGSLDAILPRFSDTARNEVQRTMRMPEFSFRIEKGISKELYDFYCIFQKAKNLEVRPRAFLEGALPFVAYYNGEFISAVTVYDVSPYLRVQSIFSRVGGNKDTRRIAGYAARRLIYEICTYGNERYYTLLDLASANFSDPAKAGITQFKSSFGGRVEDEYIYTYRSPLVRVVLDGFCLLRR